MRISTQDFGLKIFLDFFMPHLFDNILVLWQKVAKKTLFSFNRANMVLYFNQF